MLGRNLDEAIAWFRARVADTCGECPKSHDFTCSGADSRRCAAYREVLRALEERSGTAAVVVVPTPGLGSGL